MKSKLLYLVHRIPYPPNKGDKIRSFHWLKGLSESYDIYLGAFVDDENDWQYVDQLNVYCAGVHIEKLTPKTAKIKSLKGLLTGEPLTIPYYANQSMQRWVDEIVEKEKINDMLVFSSSMAQYVDSEIFSNCHRVIDFVDMDSDKWMQYAEKKQWPMSWIYRREARTLFNYEKKIAKKFDKSLFVSSKEAELFSVQIKDALIKVDYVNNGVDTAYFSSNEGFSNPYGKDEKIIIFTGAMDYWANVDAVQWFAEEVFPALKNKIEHLRFIIVGSKPTGEVLDLQSIDGVKVTGFVKDIRPYIMYADVAVAPMRIARGIQNKVLEAMSMGRTVVVSPQGLEGINAQPDKDLMLSTLKQDWVEQVTNAIIQPNLEMGHSARTCVMNHYSWYSNIVKLLTCFEEQKKC